MSLIKKRKHKNKTTQQDQVDYERRLTDDQAIALTNEVERHLHEATEFYRTWIEQRNDLFGESKDHVLFAVNETLYLLGYCIITITAYGVKPQDNRDMILLYMSCWERLGMVSPNGDGLEM